MTAPLREGSRGPDVLLVQWLLRACGYDPGPLDGIFGPRTAAAVCAFDHPGLACNDPIADEVTIANLRRAPRISVEMPRLRTPTTLEALREALERGYDGAFPDRDAFVFAHIGKGVRDTAVRVALAQFAEEHGADYSAIWSNNLGNRQVRRDDDRSVTPFYALRSREIVRVGAEQREAMLVSPYYAYPPGPTGLEEGAAAYWAALRDHYPQSLSAFEAGAPAAAALKLKEEGWYTGSEADYARAMVDRYERLP